MKLTKVTAIEFRNPDRIYTPVYIDLHSIYHIQQLDDRIYKEIVASLTPSGHLPPDREACIGGSMVYQTIPGSPPRSMYLRESPEVIHELILVGDFT